MIASTQTNHPLAETNAGVSVLGQSLEQACQRLKSAGLRITQPRIAILSALLKRSQPATIEQIHAELADNSCDLVTVYRCLAAFEELGLVRRCYFRNGTSLYKIQLEGEPIYHLVNKDTQQAEALPEDLTLELRAVIKKIEAHFAARGYTDLSHMAEFFATAPAPAGAPATVSTTSI